jgi:SagB-type dehydrogenase family enzyme
MHPFFILLTGVLFLTCTPDQEMKSPIQQTKTETVSLPSPRADSRVSVERSLQTRRSIRGFRSDVLDLSALSQLLWSAQGITQKMDMPPGWSWGSWQGGLRVAPSAGALYPLELHVVTGNVKGLEAGIYRYKPLEHQLVRTRSGDYRAELATAAFGQEWIATAPCAFVVGAVYSRTEAKYGKRAARYIHIEVGLAVENICLQAVALELGSTMVGAFKDADIKNVLAMAQEEEPLAIVPVGRKAK